MILRLLRDKKLGGIKQKPPGLFRNILWIGFLVGSLDILAAFINTWFPNHISPVIVLRFIACGLFGRAAFTGGTEMAVCGLLIHFLIAFTVTAFYFLAYPHLSALSKKWVLSGVIYGILIWVVMNLIVLPVTLIPKGHFRLAQVATGMGLLIVAIGLPLSYMAKRFYSGLNAKVPAI